MEIRLSHDVRKKVEQTARAMGLGEQDVVNQALLFYLDAFDRRVQLAQELVAWDRLSDEAMKHFEKAPWKKEKSG
ncbi:MAG: hypothetical protein HY520_04915 [Candidatus Aenigmarchaeota archaeon]|nr:hypothetical protein [Candidatus Aenigmarchaeota archaeon]